MRLSFHCRLNKRISWKIGRFTSPGGRFDNSPAVHCRVQVRVWIRPEGTVESSECNTSASRIEYKERNLWERFSRPFGTRRSISTYPPLKGWAILKSPSGRGQMNRLSCLINGELKNGQTPERLAKLRPL